MTLHEAKELTSHANRCNITTRFTRKEALEWAVVVADTEFKDKKKAEKFIEELIDANYFKGQ